MELSGRDMAVIFYYSKRVELSYYALIICVGKVNSSTKFSDGFPWLSLWASHPLGVGEQPGESPLVLLPSSTS